MSQQDKFDAPIVVCKDCGDKIQSRYPGDGVSCSCHKESGGTTGCYVDTNEYITRWGGNIKDVQDENGKTIFNRKELTGEDGSS